MIIYTSDYWREILYHFSLALDLPELKGNPAILQDAEQIRTRRASQLLSRIVGWIEWGWSPLVLAAKFPTILTALRDPEADNWIKYECLTFRDWVEQYEADIARKGHKPRPRRQRRNGTTGVSQQD